MANIFIFSFFFVRFSVVMLLLLLLGANQELELEKAQTIDIMRYLLSHVYGHLSSSDDNNVKSDELVERSVRKLLCELFNLSGTVWKPKSVDATLAELPLSNEQLSRHPEQYFELRRGGVVHPNIPVRSENQPNTSSNSTDKEYEKSSVLDNNVESWNRVQTSSTSNTHTSNETSAPYGYTNSGQPPIHFGNNYNTYYAGCAGKPTQSTGNLRTSGSTTYGGSTAKPSTPPGNSWNEHRSASYNGYDANSTPRYPSSNSSAFYGGLSANSTMNSSQPPPSGSWTNTYNTANSTQPSSRSWSNNNSSYGESTPNPNSSQPPHSYQGNYSAQYGDSSNAYSASPSTNSYSASPAYSSQPPSNSFGGPAANSSQPPSNSRTTGNLNYGYSGKSLEGSCVTEPDPLDMSEEAKAERWIRRAAQIKDISELSQIPDEDFPQIMPMRKGTNRFVVSKRKTPLERRLASQQYKRSLPVVSSEQEKEAVAGEKEIQTFSD